MRVSFTRRFTRQQLIDAYPCGFCQQPLTYHAPGRFRCQPCGVVIRWNQPDRRQQIGSVEVRVTDDSCWWMVATHTGAVLTRFGKPDHTWTFENMRAAGQRYLLFSDGSEFTQQGTVVSHIWQGFK